MPDELDPTLYIRPPIIDVANGVSLGIALISATPKDAPDPVRKTGKNLRKRVVELQAIWAKANLAATPTDRRAADVVIDNAWGACFERLEAYASLPVTFWPKAKRAQEILTRLFVPDGLSFLKLPYNAEWAESDKRIGIVDSEGLAADIDQLAGPEFLAEVRRSHALYGIALGRTQPAVVAPEVRLQEPLRAVARAIADHSLQLLAMASSAPERLAEVRAALRPIDEHRADTSARRTGTTVVEPTVEPAPTPGTASPTTPTTPIPEVPA